MTNDPFMIYGATGYTGTLIANEALERGLRPIVAGRNAATLREMAQTWTLPHRAVGLDDPARLLRALDGVDVLLNVAGPFSATAAPLVAACLETGTHYLDVTGELDVFEALYARDAAARRRGVMIMPGVGFVNVPSDCLAAHVAARLPEARYLRIGISRTNFISQGSMKTMAELVKDHVRIRRAGELAAVPVGHLERSFDFGCGPSTSTAVSWPDVLTAHLTTGIANIEVYYEASHLERGAYQMGGAFAWALGSDPWRSLLKSQASLWPRPGPRSAAARERRVFVAQAEDAYRRTAGSRLTTPGGYALTADTALTIVEKTLAGGASAGFRTPAGVFGAALVLGCRGVELEDTIAT